MHPASVGFHCPACVKSSSQRVYTARTLRAASTPVITTALVAMNVAAFVVSTLDRDGSPLRSPGFRFQADWALIAEAVDRGPSGALELVGVAHGESYRLVTSGFLHGSLMHLAFNMFALWVLGSQLEPALGRLRFALVYAVSLLVGSLGVIVLDPESLTLGASGAVFGLFGYAVVGQVARGINPMQTGLGGIVVLNLLFTFAVPGISIGGHLGGLAGGALVGAVADLGAPRLRIPEPVVNGLLVALGAAAFLGALVLA